jgi:hypothetical protein
MGKPGEAGAAMTFKQTHHSDEKKKRRGKTPSSKTKLAIQPKRSLHSSMNDAHVRILRLSKARLLCRDFGNRTILAAAGPSMKPRITKVASQISA